MATEQFNNYTIPINCPISRVLHEMKSGSGDDDNVDRIVMIGGTDETVCDVVEYALRMFQIDIARFEARHTHSTDCRDAAHEFALRHFGGIMGKSRVEAFDEIANEFLSDSLIGEALRNVAKAIHILVQVVAAAGLAATLPPLQIVVAGDYIVARRPDILQYQINEISKFISALKVPTIEVIDAPKPPPELHKIVMFDDAMINSKCDDLPDVLAIGNDKIIILEYLSKIELAGCAAIRYLEEVRRYLMKLAVGAN